jgi:hypothetical protein
MTGHTPAHADVDRLVLDKGIVAAGNARQVAGILYKYRCTIACALTPAQSAKPHRPGSLVTSGAKIRGKPVRTFSASGCSG